MTEKLNFKIVEILIFLSIILLLIPYNTLLGEARKYPLYDLYVSSVYLVLMLAAFFIVNLKTEVKLFSIENWCFFKNTGAIYYVGAILFVSLLKGNILDILTVVFSVTFILPCFIIISIGRKLDISKSIRAALVLCTLMGIGICYYETFVLGIIRPGGLTGNANTWAAYLLLIVPLAMYAFKHCGDNGSYICTGILLTGIVSCFFLARSRAVLIAIVGVTLLLIIIKLFNYKKSYAVLLIVTMIIIGIVFAPCLRGILVRGYDQERLQAYIAAAKMFFDNPLLGVGYKHFEAVYRTLYYTNTSVNVLPHAHCMYLQYLATTGIIGFAGLMFFLLKFLCFLWVKGLENIYFKFSIIAILLFIGHGVFDSVISNLFFFRIFWFFFAIYNIDIFAGDKLVED